MRAQPPRRPPRPQSLSPPLLQPANFRASPAPVTPPRPERPPELRLSPTLLMDPKWREHWEEPLTWDDYFLQRNMEPEARRSTRFSLFEGFRWSDRGPGPRTFDDEYRVNINQLELKHNLEYGTVEREELRNTAGNHTVDAVSRNINATAGPGPTTLSRRDRSRPHTPRPSTIGPLDSNPYPRAPTPPSLQVMLERTSARREPMLRATSRCVRLQIIRNLVKLLRQPISLPDPQLSTPCSQCSTENAY
jgi:hypothetical protein